MESVKRIHYVDVLRGIGILFVLFGHMNSQVWGGVFVLVSHGVLLLYLRDATEPIKIWYIQRICS